MSDQVVPFLPLLCINREMFLILASQLFCLYAWLPYLPHKKMGRQMFLRIAEDKETNSKDQHDCFCQGSL